MESPNSNAQALLVEWRRAADGLSRILCVFFPGVAAIIAIMLLRGFIEPTIAYSAWAFCSTALIGLGVLRSEHRNWPAILGTIIAVPAATYIFLQIVSAHPDQWVFLIWAFNIFGMAVWAGLAHLGIAFSERATAIYGWPWRVVEMIYMIMMFGALLGWILLMAKLLH